MFSIIYASILYKYLQQRNSEKNNMLALKKTKNLKIFGTTSFLVGLFLATRTWPINTVHSMRWIYIRSSWSDTIRLTPSIQELTHTHTHTLYEFVCLHVYIFMTSLLYVQCHRLWMRFAKNWRKRRKFPKMPQPSTLCLPKSNCVPKRQACGSSPRHCCGGSSLITHHNILLKDSLSTCVKNILWHLGFLVWLAFFCMTHLLHT